MLSQLFTCKRMKIPVNNTGIEFSGKPRFPSYRQWKAWRGQVPSKADICFICHRLLALFDGLCTTKVIGGKAAAFGGNGTERIGYNRPDDRIKACCTIKFKELESEVITPAHTINAYGRTWEIPEKVERKYKDKLMTVSVSGIGCELCRVLASISIRGYVDVSQIVLSMDPNDAPVQVQGTVHNPKQKALRGVVTLGADNILRVKDYVPVEEFVAPKIEKQDDTPVVKVVKPYDPLMQLGKTLKKTEDSLLYWTSAKRQVGPAQSVSFIADQAYEAARETASIHRKMDRINGKPQYEEGL